MISLGCFFHFPALAIGTVGVMFAFNSFFVFFAIFCCDKLYLYFRHLPPIYKGVIPTFLRFPVGKKFDDFAFIFIFSQYLRVKCPVSRSPFSVGN